MCVNRVYKQCRSQWDWWKVKNECVQCVVRLIQCWLLSTVWQYNDRVNHCFHFFESIRLFVFFFFCYRFIILYFGFKLHIMKNADVYSFFLHLSLSLAVPVSFTLFRIRTFVVQMLIIGLYESSIFILQHHPLLDSWILIQVLVWQRAQCTSNIWRRSRDYLWLRLDHVLHVRAQFSEWKWMCPVFV